MEGGGGEVGREEGGEGKGRGDARRGEKEKGEERMKEVWQVRRGARWSVNMPTSR